jgi:photosystem II stability/assembly factor-like uncharacterized protein
MKKQIQLLLAVIFILSSVTIYPQSWRKLTGDGLSDASECSFINSTTGWYSGYRMTVYKTTDGGSNWEKQYGVSGSTGYLYSIYFINENTGFAGGAGGVLLKTTDGGTSWNAITIPNVSSSIKSIVFTDEQTGWVLAASSTASEIFKTTDGGSTWTSVHTIATEMYSLKFIGTHGIAIGKNFDALYYTTDGNTWTKGTFSGLTYPSYTRSDVRAAYMVNENLIYACGWGSTVGAQPAILIKSTDGGASWTYLDQTMDNRVYCNLNAIYFKDELNGLAAGGSAYPGSVVVRTTDGGTTWVPIDVPFGFTLNAIFGDGNNVIIFGASGNVISTSDFGETWTLLNEVSPHTLYSISTFDGNNIIAGGMNGLILKSADAGKTWDNSFIYVDDVSTNVYSMFFLDKNTGFTGHAYRLTCKTTDGGETWTGLIPDTSANVSNINGIYFLDENTGFAVGTAGSNNDIIYKTTDGGQSWTTTMGQVAENLNGITFSSAANGVIVANDSKILYTTDTGGSWQVASLTDVTSELDITSVAFTDEQNGFAGGQTILLKTNDGGKTWSTVSGLITDKTITSVAFKDESTGYAIADKMIFLTTDAGVTWTDIADTLVTNNTALRSVCIDDSGYAWVCGNNGIIITNAPETPDVSVEEGSSPYTFELKQNYPNPFNPSTTISYSVEKRGMVSIKIFDITGKEVDVLFNGEREAGSYTIKYNAGNLASGVYFCTMRAGNKVKSLKMSLIK